MIKYQRKDQIVSALEQQLALDFNCEASDFERSENVIVESGLREGRRIYTTERDFFSMVTLGDNVVFSADSAMHEWLRAWSGGKKGFWLFEHPHLMELEGELQKFGRHLGQSYHMFLPEPHIREVKPDVALRWFEQEEIKSLYGREEFSNALCDRFHPERPDVLAVGAVEGEKILGLAGCSADTGQFWQIGIDVLPEYRGHGLGTMLVQLLKNEVFLRGAIPFYGTSLSNLYSWNIAINCDFYPAWVEIRTVTEKEKSN